MHSLSTLAQFSFTCGAIIGLVVAWHGLKKPSDYRFLLMRLRGESAGPMTVGLRILVVSIGMLLTAISTLGLVR